MIGLGWDMQAAILQGGIAAVRAVRSQALLLGNLLQPTGSTAFSFRGDSCLQHLQVLS
jgi:hypothetical protein